MALCRHLSSNRKNLLYPCDLSIDLWGDGLPIPMAIRQGYKISKKNTYSAFLLDPDEQNGKSWPAMGEALNELARYIEQAILKRTTGLSLKQPITNGNRILAAAILKAYLGHGKDALAGLNTLFAQNGQQRLFNNKFEGPFKQLTAEFIALSFGVEASRMHFMHITTLIMLNNIANGHAFGKKNHPYTFLNSFTRIRELTDVNKLKKLLKSYETQQDYKANLKWFESLVNTNVEAFQTKFKYDPQYKGLFVAEPIFHTSNTISSISTKDKRLAGLHPETGSSGYDSLKKYLNKKETDAVWKQVRPIKTNENKRKLHLDRAQYAACIATHNMMANLIRRLEKEKKITINQKDAQKYAKELTDYMLAGIVRGKFSNKNQFHNTLKAMHQNFTDFINKEVFKNDKSQHISKNFGNKKINVSDSDDEKMDVDAVQGYQTVNKLIDDYQKNKLNKEKLKATKMDIINGKNVNIKGDAIGKADYLLHAMVRKKDVKWAKKLIELNLNTIISRNGDKQTPLNLAQSLKYKSSDGSYNEIITVLEDAQKTYDNNLNKQKEQINNDSWMHGFEISALLEKDLGDTCKIISASKVGDAFVYGTNQKVYPFRQQLSSFVYNEQQIKNNIKKLEDEIAQLEGKENKKDNNSNKNELDNKKSALNEWKNRKEIIKANHIVMPVNLAGNHWACLIFDKKKNHFYYFNSKTGYQAGENTLLEDINAIFGSNKYNFTHLLEKETCQQDNDSCGTWVYYAADCMLTLLKENKLTDDNLKEAIIKKLNTNETKLSSAMLKKHNKMLSNIRSNLNINTNIDKKKNKQKKVFPEIKNNKNISNTTQKSTVSNQNKEKSEIKNNYLNYKNPNKWQKNMNNKTILNKFKSKKHKLNALSMTDEACEKEGKKIANQIIKNTKEGFFYNIVNKTNAIEKNHFVEEAIKIFDVIIDDLEKGKNSH